MTGSIIRLQALGHQPLHDERADHRVRRALLASDLDRPDMPHQTRNDGHDRPRYHPGGDLAGGNDLHGKYQRMSVTAP